MKTQNRIMVEVGSVIPCITPGGKIASWQRQDGSIFCKVSNEITVSPRWVAVENPDYRSKGLVVFLKRRPELGEKIKIVKTGEAYAVAEVVK